MAIGQSDDPSQRDCDDRDERRGSRLPETLDGVDNDCDGVVGGDARSRTVLAAWTRSARTVGQSAACVAGALELGALSVNNGSTLAVRSAAPVVLERAISGGRAAVHALGEGRALVAYSTTGGLAVALIDDRPAVLQWAMVPAGAGESATDAVFEHGVSSSEVVLAFVARPRCDAPEGRAKVVRLSVVAGSISSGPVLALGAPATITAIDARRIEPGVVAPFSRGGLDATSAAVTLVTWLERDGAAWTARADRVWSGDFATLDEAPLAAERFAATLLSDGDGQPLWVATQLDGAQGAVAVNDARQTVRVRWVPAASAPRVY